MKENKELDGSFSYINNCLQKVTCLGQINTSGASPVVVYKKTTLKNDTASNNNNKLNNLKKRTIKTNKIPEIKPYFLCDGNLPKKIEKFNSSSNFTQINKNQNKIFKTKSNNNIILMEKKQKKIEQKLKQNHIDEQKLFSKTVRKSNQRPIFQKSTKLKECSKTKNDFISKVQTNTNLNTRANNEQKFLNSKKNNYHYNNENSETNENSKSKIMEKLIKNAVDSELKKYQKMLVKKNSFEDKKNAKKRECLDNIGVQITTDMTDNDNDENYENSNPNLNKNNKNINETRTNFYSNTNTNFHKHKNIMNLNGIKLRKNNYISTLDIARPQKNIYKPSVNQFEFIHKIKIEQKKLPSYHKYNTTNFYNTNTNFRIQSELFNSFHEKNSSTNINTKTNKDVNNFFEQNIQTEEVTDTLSSSNNYVIGDNFAYAHKKSHRSSQEINEYRKEKKIKDKQKEELKQYAKNKQLFLKFKNLYCLKDHINGQIQKYAEIPHPKKIENYYPHSPQNNQKIISLENKKSLSCKNKTHIIKQNINIPENDKLTNNIRKKKEINEYYIGNNSTIKNNSTLVDVNEYYLNVLESQQLLVNSGLNKIENIDTGFNENNEKVIIEEEEEKTNINEVEKKVSENTCTSVTKEQIQKIITKENDTSSKKSRSSDILSTNNIEELKNKISSTLTRAKSIFSKDTIKQYKNIISEKLNYSINITDDYSNEKRKYNEDVLNMKDVINVNNNLNEQNNEIINEKNEINIINLNENLQKKHEINIETADINNNNNKYNESDSNNTKEKKLSSLSHTYTTNSNNNPNKKVEIEIEPRLVLNLVEILKFIIQRKVFVILYESYINHAIHQQYSIAFAYFIAVCKQYAFKKIEEFYNYKSYNFAFRQLLRPFLRKDFKYFINIFYTKKKIEYLVMLLTKMFKFKIMERLYIYFQFASQQEEENNDDDEEKAFKIIIMKIMYTLIRPHLIIAFQDFKYKLNSKNTLKKNQGVIDLHNDSEDFEYQGEVSYTNSSEEKQLNKKADLSIKMNSFMYESFSSDTNKSNLKIDPNSLDNDKLHQLKMLLLEKRNNIENKDENIVIDIENSKEEIKPKKINKTLSDMLEENISKKSESVNSIDEDVYLKNSFDNSQNLNYENCEKKNDEAMKTTTLDKETTTKISDDNDDNKKLSIDKEKENIEYECDNSSIDNMQKNIKKIKSVKDEIIANKEEDKKSLMKISNIILNENINQLLTEEKVEISSEIKKNNIETNIINISNENKNSSISNSSSLTKNKSNNILLDTEKLSEDLTIEILNKIIFNEIKSYKAKLVPYKKFKYDKFLKMNQNNSLNNSCNSVGNIKINHSGEFGLLGSNNPSLHEDPISLNDSLISNYSTYSIFNKTIKDRKKEHTLYLYLDKIAPKLIRLIKNEIILKYPRIFANISNKMENKSANLMISLALQDTQMLRENYKRTYYKEDIDKILDKNDILKKFAPINKKIRLKDNITSDNYYDNFMNECILETAIELIEKERYYGDNGEPLKWSSRTREISFKYGIKDGKKFANYICHNILKILHNRIGLMAENYNYMNIDQINIERDKRLNDTILNDLNENESQWKNLEMEETQLKIESTEMILDQLLNEVIEILEHIQFNRINPELYQNKSIYACEEIPKLSFQQTTTEGICMGEGEENDFINI